MGLLNIFKGKSPQEFEEKGDSYAQFSAWGKAKIEYEKALGKLDKNSLQYNELEKRLSEKIQNTKESLAHEHKNTATELLEAEFFDDARQYINLALELTSDARLIDELENLSEKMKQGVSKGFQQEFAEFKVFDDDPEESPVADEPVNDEYFQALIARLPDDVQESYMQYGKDFQDGYTALNQGEFDQAISGLTKAMEANPDPDSFIPLELATAYVNLEKFTQARPLLEQFLQHHPEVLPAYQLLCEIFWERSEFEKADALLSSIPQQLAESVAVHVLRGETLYHAQKYTEAKKYYQEFMKNYGWNEAIARALAKTHETLKEKANARRIYREIIDQCQSCHTRVDPSVKQKYADLCFSSGLFSTEVLELYLSLAQEDPVSAAENYQKISKIYAQQGNHEEAQRFELLSEKYQVGQE
jgi:tetratricopeptide (TPR) repeat protein